MTKAAKKRYQVDLEPLAAAEAHHRLCMGELDRDALRAIRDRMRPPAGSGLRAWLVLDLSDVSHLDYRGVPWLVSQAEEYRQRGGDVKLAGVSRYLLAILRAAGAHDAFEIYPTQAMPGRRCRRATTPGSHLTASGPLSFVHETVLRDEVVQLLKPVPGKRLVDATLGGGGHAEALLAGGAEVIGVDRDPVGHRRGPRCASPASDRFQALEGRAR